MTIPPKTTPPHTTPPETPPPASAPRGWEGLLEPGEEILWQGRPLPGLDPNDFTPAKTLFGLAFTGFALFWTGMAWWITGQLDAPLLFRLFPLFGLPFILVGLQLLGGGALWRAYVRRYTWYTLSSRRAFIATAVPWLRRRLKSYPITPDTRILHDGETPGNVTFGYEPGAEHGTPRTPVGFIRIEDPIPVLRLMHQTRKRQMI